MAELIEINYNRGKYLLVFGNIKLTKTKLDGKTCRKSIKRKCVVVLYICTICLL